jgi:hypothetical protein
MKGQWIGTYEGTTDGGVMLLIDEVEGHYEGIAYLVPNQRNLPRSAAIFHTETLGIEHHCRASFYPISHKGFDVSTWDLEREYYPADVVHSSTGDVHLKLAGPNTLEIHAKTDVGIEASCTITREHVGDISAIPVKPISWQEFKEEVATHSKSGYIYRGQREPWPLQTSFHRNGRYRISQFTGVDCVELHRRLSSVTNHFFDRTAPLQNGAFFSLLQHHGYPTHF